MGSFTLKVDEVDRPIDPPTDAPTDKPTNPPTDAPTDKPTNPPTDAPTDECAGDGEKSVGCGSKKGKDHCCEGLVCHAYEYWRCTKATNTHCSRPDWKAQECGSTWKGASEWCCHGLECDGGFCRGIEEVW